jgi:hypothetical protein
LIDAAISFFIMVMLAACGGGNGDAAATREISPFVASQARMAQIATRSATTDDLYQFFAVAFNAAPGVTYMGQLGDAANAGMTTKQIVNVFTTKSQFTDVYPTSLSDADFAAKLVNNVVGSSATAAAKASAVNDVVAALALPSWTRGDVIYAIFTNLASKPSTDPDWAGTSQQMKDQVAIAKTYTEVFQIDTTDLTQLRTAAIPPHAVKAPASTTSVGSVANGIVIHMYQALYGQAPSNATLIDSTSQAAVDPSAFATNLASKFVTTSDTDLALVVLTNLGVNTTSVNSTSYAILLDALGQLFSGYGAAARGQIILNVTNLLGNLEGDDTYGASAVSYNNQAAANYAYSSNPANVVAAAVTTSAANAGSAQEALVGAAVTLDGTGSTADSARTLSYAWTLTTRPAGSAALLSLANTAKPAFTPDVAGSYVATLVVNDGVANSAAATVTITVRPLNVAPVANAGAVQSVVAGNVVLLNGAASSDVNGDQLTYTWTLTTKPASSTSTMTSPALATVPGAYFLADVAGSYVATLVVNDGMLNSAAATVNIAASAPVSPPVGTPNTKVYNIFATRLSGNFYSIDNVATIIQTKSCTENVASDVAVLTMSAATGSADGKIAFSNGATCTVAGAYDPMAKAVGSYPATLTYEDAGFYSDSVQKMIVRSSLVSCDARKTSDSSTLDLNITNAGVAYKGGFQIGTIKFADSSTCLLVGMYSLGNYNN